MLEFYSCSLTTVDTWYGGGLDAVEQHKLYNYLHLRWINISTIAGFIGMFWVFFPSKKRTKHIETNPITTGLWAGMTARGALRFPAKFLSLPTWGTDQSEQNSRFFVQSIPRNCAVFCGGHIFHIICVCIGCIGVRENWNAFSVYCLSLHRPMRANSNVNYSGQHDQT